MPSPAQALYPGVVGVPELFLNVKKKNNPAFPSNPFNTFLLLYPGNKHGKYFHHIEYFCILAVLGRLFG